jgi:hypothetical protein
MTINKKNLLLIATTSAMILASIAAIELPTIITANAQNMTTTTGGAATENQAEIMPITATAQKTAISTVDNLPGHQMHA